MKKDRVKLDSLLTLILKKNNANNKLREKVEEELENKFRTGLVNDIYNLRRQMKFISIEELYLITNSLYNNFELFNKKTDITRDMIDPKSWFSENEIRSANEINIEHKKDDKDVYFELHNVDEVAEGVWVSSYESIQNLVDNWNRGAILYNPETQRKGEIKLVLGETVRVPKLVEDNVKEIELAIKNKKFYMNMITLNIQDFGGEEQQYIEYYPKDRYLRVKKTDMSIVTIIDGMHRLNASKRALANDPDIKMGFIVRLLNLGVSAAQQVIVQEQKGTSLDEETKKIYDVENPYIYIAKKLNNFGSKENNEMFDMLTDSIEEVKYNVKYCLFSNIANGLEDNFADIIKDANPFKKDKLVRYLVDFYNVFLGMYEIYFNDLESTKKEKVVADINIFTGLLTLARQLYGVKDWEMILQEALENVIWDKTNSAWKDIPTNSLTWNKTSKDKTYGFFNNLINEKVGVI